MPLFLLSYFPFYKGKNISISFATSCTPLYTMILEKKIIIPNIISSVLLCYSLDLQRTSNLNKPLAIWCWLVTSPPCQNKNTATPASNWNWRGDSSDQLFSNKTMKFLKWEHGYEQDWIWILVKTLSLISHTIFWKLLHLPSEVILDSFLHWYSMTLTFQGVLRDTHNKKANLPSVARCADQRYHSIGKYHKGASGRDDCWLTIAAITWYSEELSVIKGSFRELG